MKRRHWLHAASLSLALILVAFEATASRTPVVLGGGGGYDTQARYQGTHRRSLLSVGDSKWWPWNWGKKPPMQADILLEIKQQLIQDDTSGTTYADQLPSWVAGADPCADGAAWQGVTCGDAGDGKGTEVVGLSLTHLEPHMLHRFVPGSLSKLTSLKSLDLTDSGVAGVISPDLRALSQLQVALLSNNHLTDASVLLDQAATNPSASFLPTPAAFPSLSVLNLANNNLTGSVPHAITSMHKLMHLSLAHNRLTGAGPLSLDGRGLAELQRLELQGNAFNGALSADLPPKLTWLDFSNNAAPLGPLIPCLGAAPNLQVVHMASSGLSGELCEGMSNLRLLRELDLHNNSLSGVAGTNGSLSAAWGSLTQLTYLDLSSNKFTGQLPEEWAQLTNLMYLNVSNNPLTGTVPAALAKLLMSGDAEYDFSNTSLVLRGGTAATAAAIMDHIAEQAGNVQQLIHDHPTSAWVTICLISGGTLLLALLAGVVWRYRALYMAGWRPLTVEQQPGWVAKHEVRLKTMLGGAAARWAATGGKRRQEKEEKE